MIDQTLEDHKMKQALQYCFDHPTFVIASVAVDHKVDAKKLHYEYRKAKTALRVKP